MEALTSGAMHLVSFSLVRLVGHLAEAMCLRRLEPGIVACTAVARAQPRWQLALCCDLRRRQLQTDLVWRLGTSPFRLLSWSSELMRRKNTRLFGSNVVEK